MTRMMRKVTLVTALVLAAAPAFGAPPQATTTPPTKGVALDDPSDAVTGALGDLEAIDAETRRFPDAPAGERIRKLVEKARARLQPLAPKAAPVAVKKAASSAEPFSGGRASTASPGKAMPDKEFRDVTKALKTQNLDGQRLGVVQNVIDAGGYFTSAQIGQMIHWFTSDDMKVEAAGRLWGRCTDPAGFDAVIDRLDAAESKAKLRERIGMPGAPTAPAAPATAPGNAPLKAPGTTKF